MPKECLVAKCFQHRAAQSNADHHQGTALPDKNNPTTRRYSTAYLSYFNEVSS